MVNLTYPEIKEICKSGKIGLIPGWKGYIKYDYYKDQLYFQNGDYIMQQSELEDKIGKRNDLFYII